MLDIIAEVVRRFDESQVDKFYSQMGSYQELQSTFYHWRKFYMPTNPGNQCDVNIDNKFIKYRDDNFYCVVGDSFGKGENDRYNSLSCVPIW